ncbi:MAG: Asp-tRNA(Asn)/Glu-tRNA(Gln) amidotransferase subunit GatB [Phycisphaerae bacterium]|nr:Asp-tRNA(Asn)/Glu-tRNA(Gln) amidotransferase subunit GatB [Phycisphaerae bacterium]
MIDTNDTVEPVIGLEIHVELATATKMFCRCRNSFGDPPNSNVCPVCIGMPGVLPVMNQKAVELAMKVGLALNCEVAELAKWDRKSYWYPDLPKNYQISQYDLPLSSNGHLEVFLSDGSTKKVRILRAHLEEDAGKNVHDNPSHTGVDLNRAGLPLLEIVSEPDMNSVEQTMAYARAMQRLVRWLGASEANMQMGHVRFEPNINLHVTRGTKTCKTPIIEVKNLNSFRALENAVQYEIDRQYSQWQSDPDGYSLEKQGKGNRGYDDATGKTLYQRSKEEAHDYRYFLEPDLAPVVVDRNWRESVRATIGELPLARRTRYMSDYKLTFKQADALTQDAPTGDLLDAAVAAGAEPKRCVNLMLGRGAAIANERGCTIARIGLKADALGELAKMLTAGAVSATAAAKIFDKMVETGRSPSQTAQADGLLAVTDTDSIEKWVDEAIAANEQAVADAKGGPKKQKKAFGFLMGQVMQRSGGAADPARVRKILQEKLGLQGRGL